ncbi:hypothetical protein GCM10023196_082940 [Actinoallomurus vinaceus]|uniref:Uncharacterized protein n=1 Tax=Actinoallomurus vinaceus TaxID=1080074 RepID=A0ABP8UNZ7_9ACTN
MTSATDHDSPSSNAASSRTAMIRPSAVHIISRTNRNCESPAPPDPSSIGSFSAAATEVPTNHVSPGP